MTKKRRKRRKRYPPEEVEFLRKGYQTMKIQDLTKAYNAHFGYSSTEVAVKSALSNRKITCGRKGKDKLHEPCRLCTPEQTEFIKINYVKHRIPELTAMLNAKFDTDFAEQQIISFVHNNKIQSGRTGQFEKGHFVWNTGTKGICKPNSGSFQKGDIPANIKPLGHERLCKKDGFMLIKIAEENPYTGTPTRYKHKHVYVWEQENGPVPKNHVIAFLDGVQSNCEPENLMCISRALLLRLNQKDYKGAPVELKPSILALAKLEVEIFGKLKGT